MKKKISVQKVVQVGLLAALVCVGSAFRVTMPLEVDGTTSFHLGNILCALSGILLGPWGGALASGIGSAIYDMTNPLYISECWLTFLMKAAYGLIAGLISWSFKKQGQHYGLNTVATVGGALTYAVLYFAKSFFYSSLLVQKLPVSAAWIALGAKVPATLFNAVVAIVLAPPLALAIEKALGSRRTLATQ